VTVDDVADPDGALEETIAGTIDQADDHEPVDQDLRELTAALEAADDLSVDERLALLRRAEEAIAGSLEGLDGL
jgi:hypothetical protein